MIDLTPSVPDLLGRRLAERTQAGLLRQVRATDGLIDFCSNDYLGFARLPSLRESIRRADANLPELRTGATGSRLLAGQTELVDALEQELASFYHTESALIFNSGYDANLGLMACLPQRGDTLLTDELIHASMIDGSRLSYATRDRFRHNDLVDLAEKLQLASSRPGQVFVAVESVYSMDGDLAPLADLCDLCDRYGAALLVDEAHATGVYGPNGEGLVVALNLQNRVLARVHTFGKALGVHGAAVVGPLVLRNYLINFARSFIYTTALPPPSLLAIQQAHRHLLASAEQRDLLHNQIRHFRSGVASALSGAIWTNSTSPIQCLIVPGNDAARHTAQAAQEAGFDLRAILSPTVPVGQERLRICIHAFNTTAEIDRLIRILQSTQLYE
ncbi:aminotransferase class I/II-fold pyridoxal phosphate-dependent enzyme [Spirosoma sordidisoli]|uniref:8-amino-7-oxononanoate synthase n=1 Tax=Spirosoma sordidisoli TaxID=2502893 RepID=A0A4Q2UF90_9BACT|nr:8-amino-7-oxononanoate synthase [Spirosoma sordidisoli]RYC67012.1 8-amino-7-oxononanoate synthase [Spirosoma sordidisoli]